MKLESHGKVSKIEILVYRTYEFAFLDNNPNWHPERDYNKMFLLSVLNFLSMRLTEQGYLFLNEALEALGYENCSAGQVAGWHKEDGKLDISFEDVELEDKPGEKRLWITIRPHGVIVNRI